MIKKRHEGFGDLDEIIYINENNEYHNPHGPAVKSSSGYSSYYQNNRCHNIVGPSNIGGGPGRYRILWILIL